MVQYLNGGLKTGLKKPVYDPKCPVFDGWLSPVTLPFKFQTPLVSGIQINSVFRFTTTLCPDSIQNVDERIASI